MNQIPTHDFENRDSAGRTYMQWDHTPGQPDHWLLSSFQNPNLHQDLKPIAEGFKQLAETLDDQLLEGPRKDEAMKRLKEAKDWAVQQKVTELGL